MGHFRVMRTTDASSGNSGCEAVSVRNCVNRNEEFEMRCGRAPAQYCQIAGFGVGSGIAPVTTVSAAVSSSTGGR
ncbi:UNVERIFIED_ORG: hypothetical protein GGD59_005253 [Rhizobium esperanzae]